MNIIEEVLSKIKLNQVLSRKHKLSYITDLSNINDFDITKYLKFNDYNEWVEEFYDTLCKLSADGRENFEKNIKTSKIITIDLTPDKAKESGVRGTYNPRTNKIEVMRVDKDTLYELKIKLFHELLHLASNRDGEDGIQVKRQINDSIYTYGISLNEGVTQFINDQFFTYNFDSLYYVFEKRLAVGIENIVGVEVLLQSYFKSDGKILYNELCKYTDNQLDIDTLYLEIDNMNFEKMTSDQDEVYKDKKRKISLLHKNKINEELVKGIIDPQEYKKQEFINEHAFVEYNFVNSGKTHTALQGNTLILYGNYGNRFIDLDKVNIEFEPDTIYSDTRNSRKI